MIALEKNRAAAPESAPTYGETRTPEQIELDRETARAEHQEMIADHQSAQEDPSWAPVVAEKLKSTMETIVASSGKGKIQNVDCRQSSCPVRVDFPNYAAAQGDIPRLARQFYDGVYCATLARLEDPVDPFAPVATDLLFYGCRRTL